MDTAGSQELERRKRHKQRHTRHQIPMRPVGSRVGAELWTRTLEYLRSEVKTDMRRLRESLPSEWPKG